MTLNLNLLGKRYIGCALEIQVGIAPLSKQYWGYLELRSARRIAPGFGASLHVLARFISVAGRVEVMPLMSLL